MQDNICFWYQSETIYKKSPEFSLHLLDRQQNSGETCEDVI